MLSSAGTVYSVPDLKAASSGAGSSMSFVRIISSSVLPKVDVTRVCPSGHGFSTPVFVFKCNLIELEFHYLIFLLAYVQEQ